MFRGKTLCLAGLSAALLIASVASCASPEAASPGVSTGATSSTGITSAPIGPNASATALPLVRADSRIVNNPAEAKATLVLFTDYQCPYCAKMDTLINKAKDEYSGQLKIVVRNFPLAMHQNAPIAARAVEAAAEQNALTTMAEAVFKGQATWAKATDGQAQLLAEYARGLGLDMAKFEQDFTSAKIGDRVERDLQDATALGLRGTPSVVLNGKLLSVDSTDYNTLKTPIDRALAG